MPRGFPLYLKGRSGKYSIQVKAPRMRSITRNIELDASDPLKVKINLRPDFAMVLVKGAIGTEVYAMSGDAFLELLSDSLHGRFTSALNGGVRH